ncbi:MAG: hypothetical protein RLP44_14535 [Aggregatilineales bacterium]
MSELSDHDKSERNQLPAMLLIGLGAFFLLSSIFNFSIMGALWPLFVVLPGLPFLYFALTGSKRNAGLIFPGLMISGTGMILLYQNAFNHWESWAYIWTLYPVFIGMGLTFLGRRTGSHGELDAGRMMVRGGLFAFAAFAFLFEFVIFGGGFGLFGGLLLPIALIIAGALMWKRGGNHHYRSEKAKNVTYGEKSKRKNRENGHHNGYTPAIINEELQRRIDEALAEDTRGNPPIV